MNVVTDELAINSIEASFKGIVRTISPTLYMTSGYATFLSLRVFDSDHDVDESIHIAIANNSRAGLDLEIGDTLHIRGLKKCSWTRSLGLTINIPSISWYICDSGCIIIESKKVAFTDSCKLTSVLKASYLNCSILSNLQRPTSIQENESLLLKELIVEGATTKINSMGWFDIKLNFEAELHANSSGISCGSNLNQYDQCPTTVRIFLIHNRDSEMMNKISKGCVIRVYFVFPLFLWGRFYGFAATVRSSIVLLSSNVQSKDNLNRIGNNLNKKHVFSIPSYLRMRCHIFAAWTSYINKKLLSSISVAQSSSITNNSNSINFIQCIINFLHSFPIQTELGQSTTVSEICLLPLFRTVQDEFADPFYAQLFAIRAGYDADYLSSQLPKILNTGDIYMIEQQANSNVYNNHPKKNGSNLNINIKNDVATRFQNQYEYGSRLVDFSSYSLNSEDTSEINAAVENKTVFIGTILDIKISRSNNFIVCIVSDSKKAIIPVIVIGDVGAISEPRNRVIPTQNQFTSNNDSSNTIINPVIVCTAAWILNDFFYKKYEDSYQKHELILDANHPIMIAELKNVQIFFNNFACKDIDTNDALDIPTAQFENLCSLLSFPLHPIGCNKEDERDTTVYTSFLMQVDKGNDIIGKCKNSSNERFDQTTTVELNDCVKNSKTNLDVEVNQNGLLHIRQLLNNSHNEFDGIRNGEVVDNIVGIIIYKEVVTEEKYQLQSVNDDFNTSYEHRSKKMKLNKVKRKCNVILRDIQYCEIITLYNIPMDMLIYIPIGSKIIVDNVKWHITKVTNSSYLKCQNDSHPEIGFLGFADIEQLKVLCQVPVSRPMAGNPDINILYIQKPPQSIICNLIQMSQYSRAIWTIQGSINHINKISVQLKCKVCNSKATELLMSYQCMKCSSKVNLRPVWQCNVSFNDGTGECNVYAEGDTVFNLLGQTNKKSSEHFRKMISVIETGVQLHGKIIYNSYFSSFQSGKINSVDDCEHIDYDNFDFLSKPKEEEVLLVNFVKNFVSAPVIELRVKIMVDKPYKPKDKQPSSKLHSAHQTVEVIENLNSTSNRYNNVVESSSSSNIFYSKETNNFLKVDEDYLKNDIIKNVNGIRNVKVQEDNTSRPYSVSYMNIPTLSMKRLTVEAMTAKVLKSSDLILEAWKQLDTIMKYEFD